MSKRTVFTTITPLPSGVTRASVMETLYNHVEMIDLNPLVQSREPCKAPAFATAEEFHCQWYEITDKVAYLPGGMYSGKVVYYASFHNLSNGLQTHCYAPMGLNIKGKWTLGGSLPGEPKEAVELGLGVPKDGLYLREDVDMKCNVLLTGFVKKTTKKAHSHLVGRLVEKAHLLEAKAANDRYSESLAPGSPALHDVVPGSHPSPGMQHTNLYLDQRTSIASSVSPHGSPQMGYGQPVPGQMSRSSTGASSYQSLDPRLHPQSHLQNQYGQPVQQPMGSPGYQQQYQQPYGVPGQQQYPPQQTPPYGQDPAYNQANPYNNDSKQHYAELPSQAYPPQGVAPLNVQKNPNERKEEVHEMGVAEME
jgi:hypothetical protein